jgi:hypothetical protein
MIGKGKILIIGLLLVFKVLIFKWGIEMGIKILSGEDKYFYDRGFSSFCQRVSSNEWRTLPFTKGEIIHSKRLCQIGAKQTIILYLDSVPLDLFVFPHIERFSSNSKSPFGKTFRVKHYGITDSGPSFSNFFTGKIANKYEGLITGIDNFFYQLYSAGHKIKAHGYNYPIQEMIGTGYFEEYQESEEGLVKGLCPDFLNLKQIYETEKNNTDLGFIHNQKEMEEKFQKYYIEYKKELSSVKAVIASCLHQIVDGGWNFFHLITH